MKHNKLFYFLIVLFFIFIMCFSFGLYNHFNYKNNDKTDIINIDGNDDLNDVDEPDDNLTSVHTGIDDLNDNQINIPVDSFVSQSFSYSNDKSGSLDINDNVDEWSNQKSLKIFNVDSISPGDSGTYDFVINNNTNRYVKYNIMFDEINDYNVNMLYKLKRNNDYIAGDENTYVKYNNINFLDKNLKKNEKDSYTLEWKWVNSDNDLAIGRAACKNKVTYTVKIIVNSYEEIIDSQYNPLTGGKIINYLLLVIISILLFISIIIFKNKKKRLSNEK